MTSGAEGLGPGISGTRGQQGEQRAFGALPSEPFLRSPVVVCGMLTAACGPCLSDTEAESDEDSAAVALKQLAHQDPRDNNNNNNNNGGPRVEEDAANAAAHNAAR